MDKEIKSGLKKGAAAAVGGAIASEAIPLAAGAVTALGGAVIAVATSPITIGLGIGALVGKAISKLSDD